MSDLVLQSISAAAAGAVASINSGLATAYEEITTLHEKLVSKRVSLEELTAELTHVKIELDSRRANAAKSFQEQQRLEKQLAAYDSQIDITKQQTLAHDKRFAQLEQKMIDMVDASQWQKRTANSEQQITKLQSQLAQLRAGLLQLSNPPSNEAGISTVAKETEPGSDGKETLVDVKEDVAEESSAFICAMDAACAAPIAAVKNTTPVINTFTGDSRYKTQMCRFYQRGGCDRGTNCLYAHEEVELRFNPGKYHKAVSAVSAMGFNVDIAVIGALFLEYDGNTERVISKLMDATA